jgi:urea carboxylase-associated protein 2
MTTDPSDEPGTASLESALAHARSQAGTTADTQATIPPTAATGLPTEVDPAAVTWDEVLGSGGSTSLRLRRDDQLRIEDVDGGTCANLQLLRADQTAERLNPADTVKVQWQAYLGEGALLLSDLGRVLATIVADSSVGHDALCGPASRARNVERYGDGSPHGPHAAARDLLALAAARHDLGRRDLTSGINLCSPVRVADDGGLHLAPPAGRPGAVVLRAELDLIVLLAVAPHPLDDRPDGRVGRVRATAWRSARPDPDSFRSTTPERQRAFENTEALLGMLPGAVA